MLVAGETISIGRDENNKNVCTCHMFRYSERFLIELELDRSEVERLEDTIIELSKAELDSYVQYMTYIR